MHDNIEKNMCSGAFEVADIESIISRGVRVPDVRVGSGFCHPPK